VFGKETRHQCTTRWYSQIVFTMALLHSSRNSAVYQMRLAECVLTEMSYTFFKLKCHRYRHHSIDMSFLYP